MAFPERDSKPCFNAAGHTYMLRAEPRHIFFEAQVHTLKEKGAIRNFLLSFHNLSYK